MKSAKRTILLVDDDERVLHSLELLLRKEDYEVLTAATGEEALKILEKKEVHLLLCDQEMPGRKGADLLAVVKEAYPEVIGILLAEIADVDTITDSVNQGHIMKLWLKPWNEGTLKLEVKQAFAQYDLQETNRELQRRFLEQNEKLKKLDEDLGNIVERRATDLLFQNWALELSRTILEELPIAIIGVSAEGIITLLNQEAQKLCFGEKKISMGEEVGDYFPLPVREKISAALELQKSQKLTDYPLNGVKYDIEFTPLSGSFRKRGVILTFKSLSPS